VMSAESIPLQTGKRIICAHASFDGIGHYLRKNHSRDVCHARVDGADCLYDIAGGVPW
jgi:hypothetical protein